MIHHSIKYTRISYNMTRHPHSSSPAQVEGLVDKAHDSDHEYDPHLKLLSKIRLLDNEPHTGVLMDKVSRAFDKGFETSIFSCGPMFQNSLRNP